MALHLNLYHEIHRQAERERRDPVKLAGLAALLFAMLLVFWYFYRLSVVSRVEAKRQQVRSDWSHLEPEKKAAVENEVRLLAQQKSNQALFERLNERFYWAPLLDEIATFTPTNIQIVSFEGVLDNGKEKKKTITVLVRGVAAGLEPRTVAEDFRRSLRDRLAARYPDVSVQFDANSLEDGVESVTLDGQTLGTATFRIRAQFKPKTAQ